MHSLKSFLALQSQINMKILKLEFLTTMILLKYSLHLNLKMINSIIKISFGHF
jgi:hypothetical protein